MRIRFWHALHSRVNRLAWRYGMEPGWHSGMVGAGHHTLHSHVLWRLNGWAAQHWVPDVMATRRAPQYREDQHGAGLLWPVLGWAALGLAAVGVAILLLLAWVLRAWDRLR